MDDRWGLAEEHGGRAMIRRKSSDNSNIAAGNAYKEREGKVEESAGVEDVSCTEDCKETVPVLLPLLPRCSIGSMRSGLSSASRSRSSSGSSSSSAASDGGQASHGGDKEGQWLSCVSTPTGAAGPGEAGDVEAAAAPPAFGGPLGAEEERTDEGDLRDPLSQRNAPRGMRRASRAAARRGSKSRGSVSGGKEEGEGGSDAAEWRPVLDYLYLAKDYQRILNYRQLDGSHPCAMCGRNECRHVFFPCQHKCVCPDCLTLHDIGDTFTKGKWAACPVCCGDIKRILPHTGKEVETYWRWVLDVKPCLPSGFEYKFSKAGKALRSKVGRPIAEDAEPESEEVLEEFAEQCRKEFTMGYHLDEPESPSSRSCTCAVS